MKFETKTLITVALQTGMLGMIVSTKKTLNPAAIEKLYAAVGLAIIHITKELRHYGVDDLAEAAREGSVLNELVKARKLAEIQENSPIE